jgi:hypothetical protein
MSGTDSCKDSSRSYSRRQNQTKRLGVSTNEENFWAFPELSVAPALQASSAEWQGVACTFGAAVWLLKFMLRHFAVTTDMDVGYRTTNLSFKVFLH